jgi:hypothetical protein
MYLQSFIRIYCYCICVTSSLRKFLYKEAKMIRSNFKTLFYIAVGLTLLFVPLALEISPAGNAYALIFSGGGNGGGNGSNISGAGASPAPTPEPATLLLFGAGAAGLVAYKKYRNKKK